MKHKRITTLELRYTNKHGNVETRSRHLIDYNEDVEKRVIDKIEAETLRKEKSEETIEERCINTLRKYVKAGLTRQEVLNRTAIELGIDKQEMLRIVQEHLLRTKKVVKTKTGFAYGES